MTKRADIAPLSQLMLRVDAIADGAPVVDTIPTGFPSLDKLLGGGVRRGDLIVLGGDVGVGKSALALAVAIRVAQQGRSVEFLSGEMEVNRLLERVLAIEGRSTIDALRHGTLDDLTRASLGAAALRLRNFLPHIGRLPSGGVDALTEHLRRTLDAELAIVDSLQCLPAGAGSQDEELAHSIRRLKEIAVDVGLAVIVTAHLPHHQRDRADPRPLLDDFGALGAVKQHADVVLGLFREEVYRPGEGNDGATELLLLKNRNGGTSYIDLYFYKQWLRFEDMIEPAR